MRCVCEHRTAADRMYTDGRRNDLDVKAARGHILIFHDLLSSYRTPLPIRYQTDVNKYHGLTDWGF